MRFLRRHLMANETVTETMAKFVTTLTYDGLPVPVVDKVKICIFHALACTFAGHHQDLIAPAINYLKELKLDGKATSFVDGTRGPSWEVAFVNSVIGQSTGQEDMHADSSCHCGSMMIPVAFAVGQELGSKGKDVIAAIVAGYDVTGRIGMSILSPDFSRKFRPVGMFGPYGACASASLLYKLDRDQTVNGLGLAGTLSSGNMQWALEGTHEIVYQNGFACKNGISAARLGRNGVKASHQVLEGFMGAWAVFGKQPLADKIIEGLGQSFEISKVYCKPAPACAYAQPAAALALRMANKYDIDPNSVEKIQIKTFQMGKLFPGLDYPGPFTDIAQSKMSQQFSVAAVFVSKELLQSNYDNYADPLVGKLAAVATVDVDEGVAGAYPKKQGCEITVTMNGGKVINEKMDDLEVMTDERVIANFELQSTRIFGKKQTAELKAAIEGLEKINDVSDLVRLCVKK
jgi:2-methylcitrate dehydratase PrpD